MSKDKRNRRRAKNRKRGVSEPPAVIWEDFVAYVEGGPSDELVYGPKCRLNGDERRRLAREVKIRDIGHGAFVASCLIFSFITIGTAGGQLEAISLPFIMLDIILLALLAVVGVGLAELRPWAGKAVLSWIVAVFAITLIMPLLEDMGTLGVILLLMAVPLAVGWLLLGSLGHRILSPGYQRLSGKHPYRYRPRRRAYFRPLSRRRVWIWLLFLVLPAAGLSFYVAWMRSGVQLYSPPIESDWLRPDDEKKPEKARP